ncbi:pilin [Gynuella sunshinyii]|uniref:Uncharacterized protein n=1 Tax=Gynuella sunshinyii YC6258 TaxID=1445510 RepID=A0A0C5W5B7_9GAMM|nr:pilin [Gynuella sunshinyii]AJQ97774.1 hypothetical Protein YC6258_05746 [Gynuella sunshinyii YC6258]
MTGNFFKLSVFVLIFISNLALSDETYLCTFGQQERVVSIIYQNQESKLPCEVRYKKEGTTETLWRATNKTGFCEEKAESFVQKQIDWGWRCSNMVSSSTPIVVNPGTPSDSEMDIYQLKVNFAQAMAAVSPFRVQTLMYVQDMGEFPKRLEDIGFEREQMRNSNRISDLKIDNGVIKIKGNKKLGENTTIILTPRFTLGGTTIEWSCSSNLNLLDQELCNYDQNAKFD